MQRFACDNCNTETDEVPPIVVEHGYGSELDGDIHHFCSTNCVSVFYSKKLSDE